MSRIIYIELKAQAFASIATVTTTHWFRQPDVDTYDCVRGPSSEHDALWADRTTGLLCDFDLMDKINEKAHQMRGEN